MILPDTVKCSTCSKIFCCAKCRNKHLTIVHGAHEDNKTLNLECALCFGEPFLFKKFCSKNLITHICEIHLPLQCNKCEKMYWNVNDFDDFTNCSKNMISSVENVCTLEKNSPQCSKVVIENSKHQQIMKKSLSTQTSPLLSSRTETNAEVLTPLSEWNIKWQAKAKIYEGSSISESGTSFKNVSSVNMTGTNSTSNTNTTSSKKLARTTSTPMQRLISKVKESGFESTCHVSSIFSSSTESEISPPIKVINKTFSPDLALLDDNFRRKAISKNKAHLTTTPLRQVMSKSIQRAVAQFRNANYRNSGVHPKKIFDSLEANVSGREIPLDLRTTPVLKRSQSEIVSKCSDFYEFESCNSELKSRNSVTEASLRSSKSDLISFSNNGSNMIGTMYETCHSVEVSATVYINEIMNKPSKEYEDLNKNPVDNDINGSLPNTVSVGSSTTESNTSDEAADEIFYTPQKNYWDMRANDNCSPKTNNSDEFSANNKENVQQNVLPNKLWSFVSSFMKLGTKKKSNDTCIQNSPPSLLKRCASFTGYLGATKSTEERQDYGNKRRRTSTVDSSYSAPKRPKRIQGRPPIDRMRKKS